MQKMKPEYAQRLLDGGYAFGNEYFSHNNDMLVVLYTEDEWPYRKNYYGAQLNDGQLQIDNEGYVRFTRVKPIVDKNTIWQHS